MNSIFSINILHFRCQNLRRKNVPERMGILHLATHYLFYNSTFSHIIRKRKFKTTQIVIATTNVVYLLKIKIDLKFELQSN